MGKPQLWKIRASGIKTRIELCCSLRGDFAPIPKAEVVCAKRPVLALRFSDPDDLEKFFIDNIGAFRAADCHTKVIGETLLVFPKGE